MEYKIRKKLRDDCFRVHHVTVVTWNESYKGLVPDEFLNNMLLNEEEVSKKCYDNFNNVDYKSLVLEVNNEIVGFANYGISSEEIDNCGELYALYILKDYQGLGLGKELFNACVNELRKLNYNKMIISCLKGNKSNEFYKHLGGTLIKERVFKTLNLPENVYLFDI